MLGDEGRKELHNTLHPANKVSGPRSTPHVTATEKEQADLEHVSVMRGCAPGC